MKIGVTGPISEINFGDYAMFINNMFLLGKEHEYYLFYYSKINVTALDKIISKYLQGFNIKKIEVKLKSIQETNKVAKKKKLINKVVKILGLSQSIPQPTDTPIDVLSKISNLNELIDSITEIEVLVINGGGYFNNLWHKGIMRNEFFKIICPILIANQLKIKLSFTGNSYGPFDISNEFFKVFFNSLNNADFGCRDNMLSPGYLRSIGIQGNKIKIIPDDLFIIEEDLIKRKNEFNPPFKKYILFETYISVEQLKMIEMELISFTNKIYEKFELSVVFVPFQKGYAGEKQGKYLETILNPSNFFLYNINNEGFPEFNDLYYLIKNADFVIGTRYHSLVLATSLKTPVVNIMKKVMGDYRYYYNKNQGLLDLIFNNQQFDYRIFLKLDLRNFLIEFVNSYIFLKEQQEKLFDNDLFLTRKLELYGERKSFFNSLISQNGN